MLAHCAVRAEDFRADLADGGVLPAKPNTCSTAERPRFSWKRPYRERILATPLKPSLQGVLQKLLDCSDALGRVWWGQTTLAKKMNCSVKALRRYFAKLEESGHLRVEKHSFKSLTTAQEALGLPLPGRDDAGRAPNVLTLLVDGEDAYSYAYPLSRAANVFEGAQSKLRRDKPRPGIARVVPQGDFVPGEPWTKSPEIPPDKRTDDPLGSAFLTRKVEGDPTEQPRPILVVENVEKVGPPNIALPGLEVTVEPDAWRELNRAYDAQYRRVYKSTPTKKCMTADDRQAAILHIEEMTTVFESKLLDRGVDVAALPEKPMKMLVDEALRAWFDGSGSNNFLRRVSHRMRELVADLPHRVRKAIEVLVAKYAPKPAPRKNLTLVPAPTEVRRNVVRDKLAPMKLPMPTIPAMHEDVIRSMACRSVDVHDFSENQLVLDGLSARPALCEFAQNEAFATELAAMARERGLGGAHVLGVLDGLARVSERLKTSTPQVRKNAVFAAAIEWFDETNARHERGGS